MEAGRGDAGTMPQFFEARVGLFEKPIRAFMLALTLCRHAHVAVITGGCPCRLQIEVQDNFFAAFIKVDRPVVIFFDKGLIAQIGIDLGDANVII